MAWTNLGNTNSIYWSGTYNNWNTWFTVEAEESDINQSANTSKVRVRITAKTDASVSGSGRTSSGGTITINGTSFSTPSKGSGWDGWYNGVSFTTGYVTVTHNNNTGASTITISVSVRIGGGGDVCSLSKSFTLTTIPREHWITLSPKTVKNTSATAGTTLTITVNNRGNSYTHTVEWRVNSGSDTNWTTIGNKVTTTSFSVPYTTIKGKVGNTQTASEVEVRITTYNGNSRVGPKPDKEKTPNQYKTVQYINITRMPFSLYDNKNGSVGATVGSVADVPGFNVYVDSKFKIPTEDTVSDTMKDYVIAQGTSGIWTYRRWASGISECWGIQTFSGSFNAWIEGRIYEGPMQGPIDYPTDLFIAAPWLNAQAEGSMGLEGVEMWSSGSGQATKDHTPYFYPLCPYAATGSGRIHLEARGRWK